MRLILTIPTYWGRPGGWRAEDAVFDHPTPLGEAGTLGRALDSLARLADRDFELVVVVAPTHAAIADAAVAAVEAVIDRSDPPVPTHLFTPRDVERLRAQLVERGRRDLVPLVSLAGYSAVRNACLIAGQLLGADAVTMIDDDELFEDVDFIAKVRAGLARGITGLAGYYVDAGGGYLLPGEAPAWEAAWGKRAAMNAAFRAIIGSPTRYQRTPFAFGGNATFARALFSEVPFDPGVPRGEDIDYLINARLFGHDFILDDQLAITHLPPPHTHPAWQQLRQDGLRFAYERDKLAGAGAGAGDRVDPASLDPYPGPFLRHDLNQRLGRAGAALAESYAAAGEAAAAEQTRAVVREITGKSHPDAFARLRRLREDWRQLIACLA